MELDGLCAVLRVARLLLKESNEALACMHSRRRCLLFGLGWVGVSGGSGWLVPVYVSVAMDVWQWSTSATRLQLMRGLHM